MSTVVISYHQAVCDGCGLRWKNPDPADETEYQAERRAQREGGWKKDGADYYCPSCSRLHPCERPNGQRMERQRGCKAGTGA